MITHVMLMKKFFLIAATILSFMASAFAADNAKMVALTFDDGPNTTTTIEILDVLKENDIVATFFLCGKEINTSTREVMKRAVEQGCELENHSRSHSRMGDMTADKIRMEVNFTSHIIKQVSGRSPQFFRAPYLNTDDLMYETIGLTFIGGLTVNDWEESVSAADRSREVLARVKDGDIILLHDFEGNDATVEALKTIIPEMKKQGYTFVTVSQLFKQKGVTPTANAKITYNNVYDK